MLYGFAIDTTAMDCVYCVAPAKPMVGPVMREVSTNDALGWP